METTQPALDAVPCSREISGRWVVFGLLLLGIVATAVMYVYWERHTRPFRPLTEAIGREFPRALPKVEGGRPKRGPLTLRISLRVPFTPNHLSPDAHRVVNRVVELARQHVRLSAYEKVQVHLFEMRPEEEAIHQAFEFSGQEVAAKNPFAE